MLNKFYVLMSLAIMALYGVAEFNGWELTSAKRLTLPPDVRRSPGGYRSFHFWHTGFHGGK
jgi:hypothetical protein